jgi:cellulose synthase/poly-beta-1,6-N-acetylglucosamine synthase-like glycosyltransferase
MAFETRGAPFDPMLQRYVKMRDYLRNGRMPWTRVGDNIRFVARHGAASPIDLVVDASAFAALVRRRFAEHVDEEARFGLWRRDPRASARVLTTSRERRFVEAMFCGLALLAATSPDMLFAGLTGLSSAIFLAAALARALLILIPRRKMRPPTTLRDEDLPVVTILAPLFREAHSLPGLIGALNRLDYPREKLDIKLLFEAIDRETIREARRLNLDERFDLIVVPAGAPQTKPKACNIGLASAIGDLIVIYDAEDEPEPRQLRDAAEKIAASGPELACVQARLNFYNHSENFLTRLFTLEYCLWFDHLMPALERLGAPIPLGGTSNIFRTDALREIGGWDPYNVTEDADIGLRLAARGYRTAVIESTTFEEANCRLDNWFRQRSRWMKGFLQTWIVHSRTHGSRRNWRTVLSLDLFIGGAVFAALVSPVLWLLAGADLMGAPVLRDIGPPWLDSLNISALAFGQIILIAITAMAPLRRGLGRLAPTAVLIPLYWILIAAAAWRGALQLLRRPSYWEKTDHGVSAEAGARREAALSALNAGRKRH